MFHRNSDSMNKSNFDTISHPLLPPPALPEKSEAEKNYLEIKTLPPSKYHESHIQYWTFGGWYEWRNAPEQIQIFRFLRS